MNGLLDADQAGELLGVPKSWVLAEARANRIPHVRLGRYVRFERDQLERWWQERRRGPSPGRTRSRPYDGPASTKRPRTADTAGGMAQEVQTP